MHGAGLQLLPSFLRTLHLHGEFSFTESVLKTAGQSRRHSCGSELSHLGGKCNGSELFHIPGAGKQGGAGGAEGVSGEGAAGGRGGGGGHQGGLPGLRGGRPGEGHCLHQEAHPRPRPL